MPNGVTIFENALSLEKLKQFSEKWGVEELSLFGSILRNDFNPNSDVDVLVSILPGLNPSWQDWLAMEVELTSIFNRPVDIAEKRRLRNPFRREEILATRRVVYDRLAG